MSFGQAVIDLERPGRGFFGLSNRMFRRQAKEPEGGYVPVSQARVSQGVLRVYFDRLLEVLERLLQSLFRLLVVPVVAPLQVCIVRLGAVRVSPGKGPFTILGRFELQAGCNAAGYIILNGKNVAWRAIVGVAGPQD